MDIYPSRPMTDRTNEQWLQALRGSPEEQAAALNDLRKHLKRSIYYYLSQERSDLRGYAEQDLVSLAEDLAQDATLRVMANLDSFRGESRFTTWANKIAVRLAISDLRRARYKDYSLDELTVDGELMPVLSSSSINSDAPANPETYTERNDVMQKVDRALDEALTERQRQALVAVALHGVPIDVLAERMNTNRNALYKLLHDARRKLRAHLEAQGLSMDYVMKLFER
ncbi:MAG: RNA polymerase sigma factor [Chloroflexi bacterium]|nr:MAG: RNA polymerase sigma factor [Chloroflexota bacterium]